MSRSETTPPTPYRDHYNPEPERKHWLEYAIFAFVIATAIATGFAAWYTRQQWLTAGDTEKRQLRAYVGVSYPDPIFSSPLPMGNFVTTIDHRNSGQTPAFKTTFSGNAKPLPYPLPKDFDFPTPKPGPTATIFPGTAGSLGINIPPERPLTGPEINDIEDGKLRFYVWGTIRYEDAFGEWHYTNFCIKFTKLGTKDRSVIFEPCDEHNDAN